MTRASPASPWRCRASFRNDDQVIRCAGDEFVVVAQDVDPTAIATRARSGRDLLQHPEAQTPAVSFSASVAVLPPQGNPDATLREADRAMYDAKVRRHLWTPDVCRGSLVRTWR